MSSSSFEGPRHSAMFWRNAPLLSYHVSTVCINTTTNNNNSHNHHAIHISLHRSTTVLTTWYVLATSSNTTQTHRHRHPITIKNPGVEPDGGLGLLPTGQPRSLLRVPKGTLRSIPLHRRSRKPPGFAREVQGSFVDLERGDCARCFGSGRAPGKIQALSTRGLRHLSISRRPRHF